MKLNTLSAAAVGLGILSTSALGGDVILQTFDLFDHPQGQVAPQAYGLRLDSVGPDDPMTFSFGNSQANSTMTLQVVDTGSNIEIRMFGTVTGNSATGGTISNTFTVDVSYVVDAVTGGWEDNNSANGSVIGSIVGDFGSGVESIDLSGKTDGSDTFRFLSDGWRISGDSSTWVGRGWVMPEGSSGGNTNDWLFQAALVPLPPAAWGGLAMLGGIAAARRFRK
ncbi:MAG: VPLPA-CTERM sorting domain-containing protein [Phycisphaerales bacterium]